MKTKLENYILEVIETSYNQEDYLDIDLSTLDKKINFIASEIKRVEVYPSNIRRYGNFTWKYIKVYLEGLPTNLPYEYNDQEELIKELGINKVTTDNFFEFFAKEIAKLFKAKKLNILE